MEALTHTDGLPLPRAVHVDLASGLDLDEHAQIVESVDGDWIMLDLKEPSGSVQISHRRSALPRRTTSPSPLKVGPQRRSELALVDNDSFVYVSYTPSSAALSFAAQYPRTATTLLWVWLASLIFGELAVTIWWLCTLGHSEFWMLSLLPACCACILLVTMNAEQLIVVGLSIMLAAMPAMPTYSAVSLVLPPPWKGEISEMHNSVQSGCQLDVLHWFALLSLGALHLATAVEAASDIHFVRYLVRSLATFLCGLSGAAYIAVACGAVLSYFGSSSAPPWYICGCRGALALDVCLNALRLMCAELRRRTCASLGDALLPWLIGRRMAKKLTLRDLVAQHGMKLLRRIPDLRRISPPAFIVAYVLVLQGAAPVLLPGLVLSLNWGYLGYAGMVLVLVSLALLAFVKLEDVPAAPLRRLPLLLPSVAAAPSARAACGWALEVAESIEVTRSRVSATFRIMSSLSQGWRR